MRLIAIASFAAGLALASTASAAANLITNGDFSGGNSGFTHGPGYTFVSPAPNALVPEGTYTIAANPISVHDSWVDLGPGATNPMLLVNGATGGGGGAVWEEDNILTTLGGQYDFSANVMDICCNSTFGSNPNNPSSIEFQVSEDNGATWTTIAGYTTTPGVPAQSGDSGVLETITGTFDSVAGGNFDIRAINGDTAASGNDFALDNISVTAAPEPATWGLMILGVGMAGAALRRRKARPALVRIA